MDVTRVIYQSRKNQRNLDDGLYFIVDITSNQYHQRYRVSIDYLRVTKIEEDEESSDETTLYISLAELKFIKLYNNKPVEDEGYIKHYMRYKREHVMETTISCIL
jgi:hypothetical protein